ncbi:MAG TPA: GC-type dockerin domain-anchored protein [Phycisphaerales bacterium]|nr:GC-type dockerin domain-anchored protein [Phycisphaerales bacterium]
MKSISKLQSASLVRFMVPALMAAAGTTAAHAQCSGFSITSSNGASIVPGTTDVGNHGDDATTSIALPFPVNLYGVGYSNAVVSSNGNLQFTGGSNAYTNQCLPDGTLGVAMMPHWDDLRTDGAGRGIFTSVSGVAPNRVFNIEWRTIYYGTNTALNFQIRLFEDNSHFEYVYGANPQSGNSATVGVTNGAVAANQFSCGTNALSNGLKLTFTPINSTTVLCSSGSATPPSVLNCSGSSTLLVVHVNPGSEPASTGIAVTANLSSIGGSATQQFYDDGTHGDVTAGDNNFSFQAAVASTVTVGTKTMAFTASDQQGRSGSGSISLAVNCVTAPNPQLGPDVYTINITDVPNNGSANGVTAYSVGTTSSNNGDYPVLWIDSNNYMPDYDNTQHPVISQNMYRLKKYGTAPNEYWRFEHLGQSWLKHGFVSTNSGAACQPSNVWRPSTLGYQNIGGDALGVNCTDTYGGSLNGSQGNLGPKNLVNATFGSSPFVRGTGTGHTDTHSRLQVPTADVTGQPGGTRFFVDAFYVCADDAQFVRPGQTVATNAMNNASWRELNAGQLGAGSVPFVGSTQLFNPGIFAWQTADPTMTLVTADHDDVVNPGTGFKDATGNPSFPGTTIRSRYWVGAKATALGGGLYRYEYAVYNHNSDRSAQAVSFPMPVGATVTDVTFHAPQWHSGEPYSNAAWTTSRSSTELTFRTQDFATNPNANALRWACLYNFGFTANVAPTTGPAEIALFKPNPAPNAPASINTPAVPVPTMPAFCGAADMGSQGGVVGHDNSLDNNDFVVFIDFFFNSDSRADVGRQGGVPGADGSLDNNDFVVFVDEFFAGC